MLRFLFGVRDKAPPPRAGRGGGLRPRSSCGQVTTGEVCPFCKLADQVKRHVPGGARDGIAE